MWKKKLEVQKKKTTMEWSDIANKISRKKEYYNRNR